MLEACTHIKLCDWVFIPRCQKIKKMKVKRALVSCIHELQELRACEITFVAGLAGIWFNGNCKAYVCS